MGYITAVSSIPDPFTVQEDALAGRPLGVPAEGSIGSDHAMAGDTRADVLACGRADVFGKWPRITVQGVADGAGELRIPKPRGNPLIRANLAPWDLAHDRVDPSLK